VERPAWACVVGILLAGLTLTVNQTLFRDVRLLYRCSPLILLSIAAVYGQWMWRDNLSVLDVLVELISVYVLVACSIILHLLFFRKPRKVIASRASQASKLSLREIFAWTALIALMLAPLKLYKADKWRRGLDQIHILETLFVAGVIVTISLSAYFLTSKRCYLAIRLIGIGGLAVLIAVSTASRVGWIDVNAYLSGTIYMDIVAICCERLLAFAVGSILLALPVGMRNDLSFGPKVQQSA